MFLNHTATNKMKLLHNLPIFFLVLFSAQLFSMPKITVNKKVNQQGYVEVTVKNNTQEPLACYVAINGQKVRFKLIPLALSKRYKATSKAQEHTDISTWCDYLEFHPRYKNL